MIDDMDQLVSTAVRAVFGTMLNLPVVQEPNKSEVSHGEPHVAGSVGFIGTVSGVVYVYSTVSFARQVTRRILGLKEEAANPREEMVNDAIGELTNMVVGHIKSRLTDRGMKCVLTIPSIVRGNEFSIEPTASTHRRFSFFRCADNQVVVEALIKPGVTTALAA